MEIGRDGHPLSGLHDHLVKQFHVFGARPESRIVSALEHSQARIADAHESIVRKGFSQNVRWFELGRFDIRQATFLE